MSREPWEVKWGWRQLYSWKLGYDRATAGRAYSRPWWVDEEVYGFAFLQGMGAQEGPGWAGAKLGTRNVSHRNIHQTDIGRRR